ncbi:integrin alpha-6 isoform X2 [Onychostoma macrolepis]|uniref:integrin alpha-6 isoform X2 n=1 Tax=Onychostoma macrolepis TaxID=369639 RepID=UPI0027298F43|nr:integrin alpha-6 isoform X2 [Onychostoma macrolepis]XP_058654600.1 integrin alpha-6 isoform X2 [Onychostoma macrolepis]
MKGHVCRFPLQREFFFWVILRSLSPDSAPERSIIMLFSQWALLLTVWILRVEVSSFNLDTQNVMNKRGEAGSLFGFAMAMHHQLKPSEERVLLIGAPHAKALPSQNANISGGLYRCKFTTKSDNCERISVDIKERPRNTPGQDYRENQWLGVRVRSQGRGGKVVTCAHRYQDWSFDNRRLLGRCFVLEQDLNLVTDGESTRAICKNRAPDKHKFGYCQQGVSVAFSKDNKYLVYGAPGAYEWKGIVHMEPVDNFSIETYETGDHNQHQHELIPVDISSLLGFAVDTGMNLMKKGELNVVAGAPRSNHSGEVLLLRPEEKAETRNLKTEYILHGPGLASSFGYDLAVLDLNGDGWDDLVVGAPEFSKISMDEDVGGAVYVYINQGKGQRWNQIKPVCLYGKRDSMFGLAVAHIGDINQDGYQDFAVSAPNEDTGRGRVYIYHGSAAEFRQNPEVLDAGDPSIKSFGYSLAGNMDIDDNGYPDLAVGSLSDSVQVYRSKPVVNIEKTLKLTPNTIDFKAQDCKRYPCNITAQSCFTYTSQPPTYNHKLRIKYTLKADTLWIERGLRSRVVFVNSEDAQGYQELSVQGKQECIQTKLRLLGDIQDRLTNIFISLSVSLAPNNPKQTVRNLPGLEPVLNALQENATKAEVTFRNSGCGSDNICQSNLQLEYRFCTKGQQQDKCDPLTMENDIPVISPGDKNIALEVTVTNIGGDDAHQSQLSVVFPEFLQLSSVEPKKSSEIQVQCNPNENKTKADCQLGNPFKRDSEVSFFLILNTERLSLRVTSANVTMLLKTISIQNIPVVVAEAKIIFELHLKVAGLAKPSQLFFGGEVKDLKAMKSEDDIGSSVHYEFRIINLGRPLKSFGSVVLNIQWPNATKKGKQLLYLVQIKDHRKNIIHCTPAEAINPLRFIKASSRGRREVEHESGLKALASTDFFPFLDNKRKYKTLTCADDLRCVAIKCPLEEVDSTTAVVLHARLWNNTFLEEYSSLNYLDIVLDAFLTLNSTQKNIGMQPSNTKVKLTVFRERKPALLSRVPWWVILLSILTALLLLGLLFYLLRKFKCLNCGMCAKEKKVY